MGKHLKKANVEDRYINVNPEKQIHNENRRKIAMSTTLNIGEKNEQQS